MVAYLRARRTLWAACGMVVGGILLGWNLFFVAPAFVAQRTIRNDFRLDYATALVGLRHGYGRLYDLAAQQAEMVRLGFNPQPFISPPPLAWLATPFTVLPFDPALAVWTAVLGASLLWTWWVVAPGDGPARIAHLLLWLGLFPVAFGLLVGQPGALAAAAVATSWWLITRARHLAAGAVLSVTLVKPQLALLVPLCLLVAGYRRVFVGWLGAAAAIGLAALAMLGVDGVTSYRNALAMTQSPAWDITRRYAISGPLGLGPQVYAVGAVVIAIALFAAWRARGRGPEIAIAAGISGSLLFSPYLAFQDLLMLVLAAWLVIRAGASTFQVALFVAGYALLQLAIPVFALPTIVLEAVFLCSLVFSPPCAAREVSTAVSSSEGQRVGTTATWRT